MSTGPQLASVSPTVLLVREGGESRQLVRVVVANSGAARTVNVLTEWPGGSLRTRADLAPQGETVLDVLIPEPPRPWDVAFSLLSGDQTLHRLQITCQPPPHLQVHVVQHSHHDVGYTNLPSTVLREHCGFLDSVIDMAEATAGYPDEARFRLVIEQAWSLQEFARTAPPDRVERMAGLLRSGDVELTALFGNMTTEICGHEELIRALYPSFGLARRFGFPIITAEHNDVPGMSWGLAEVLAGAGIRFFCPQLPRYWSWCDPPLQGFWDEGVLFPGGKPGGFWWEAPSGKRVLLWDAFGTGGDVRPDLPNLAERLQSLVDGGYPYADVYWPVRGGARDNSPYIAGFCDAVRNWNDHWAYPRLTVSTNAAFWAALEPQLPADLPVFHGELPGQDYPVGSMSTSAATAVNRRAHAQLQVGEQLATVAAQSTGHEYPAADLAQAYEDALWFDEHTWGHHFPAGPAAAASVCEKQVHAYRAAALAHDVAVTALARIADHVQLPGEGLFLVVYNPLPHLRTEAVVTPLRELENCGSLMVQVTEPGEPTGYLRGVPLTDRWHLHPPAEIVTGQFDLVDLSTGHCVEFQIAEIDAESPVPYAPERHGLAQGGKRYGFFEAPSGLSRDLHFVAEDLPACGYKTYQLKPLPQARPAAPVAPSKTVIENEYYRIEADPGTGRIVSLIDREADRELVDAQAPHGFGELVVRTPERELEAPVVECLPGVSGPVLSTLEASATAPGHPRLRRVISLHRGIKRVDLALRILKDPTPLLDVHLAFPFRLPAPRFRYESLLALQTPIEDYLPGSFWDEVAVQSWVRIDGDGPSLLWTSLDAPMVSLGRLTEGYTSPAHSCRIPERIHHPPGDASQLEHARLYSLLCANNVGTNFTVSQAGSLLFRYSLTTQGGMSDEEAVRLGWEATLPPESIFTDRRRPGHLPLSTSLLSVEGDFLVLLACKRAEFGEGLIVRLWNPSAQSAEATVRLGLGAVAGAEAVSLVEDSATAEDARVIAADGSSVTLRVPGRGVGTFRLRLG